MQTVDLILSNARVFDITNFDIKTGETFTLLTNMGPNIQWFSNKDKLLDITDYGDAANVTVGTTEGKCTILIMDQDKKILKELSVEVFNTIPVPAVDLGVTVAPPVLK